MKDTRLSEYVEFDEALAAMAKSRRGDSDYESIVAKVSAAYEAVKAADLADLAEHPVYGYCNGSVALFG